MKRTFSIHNFSKKLRHSNLLLKIDFIKKTCPTDELKNLNGVMLVNVFLRFFLRISIIGLNAILGLWSLF